MDAVLKHNNELGNQHLSATSFVLRSFDAEWSARTPCKAQLAGFALHG